MSNPDSRSFFQLPQRPEEAAYYTYGTPGAGQGQYAHPNMLSFLFHLEFRWGDMDQRKLGIGNISLADGAKPPDHKTHVSGLEVDIRPLRKDGKHQSVRYMESAYDREATRKLVALIWQTGMVKRVLFNDASIPRVIPAPGHENHLHVEVIS